MKITHLFCYPGDGGAEKYALYLADAARGSGHEVSFILGSDGPLLEKFKNNNYKFQVIKMPSWYNLNAIMKLKKYFNENGTQIVHTHFLREHFLAVGAKILGAKIRVVRTFHRMDQLPTRVRPFYKFYQRKTDAFIAISRFIKNYMVESGINDSLIKIIYNGVPEIRTNNTGEAIGYLGRLTSEKGIAEFIEANIENFQKNSEPGLMIAGEGPDKKIIESGVKENKLVNVDLAGNVDDLTSFFKKVSVLILPSRTEVMPLVVLEAYSAGIPVVSFNLEPLKEVIDEKFMVNEGDYEGLYELAAKYHQEDFSSELNRLYKEKYSIDNMWQKTESLYKSLVD
jgi:glycosyltransferase involved in cell wall biosynthesis